MTIIIRDRAHQVISQGRNLRCISDRSRRINSGVPMDIRVLGVQGGGAIMRVDWCDGSYCRADWANYGLACTWARRSCFAGAQLILLPYVGQVACTPDVPIEGEVPC